MKRESNCLSCGSFFSTYLKSQKLCSRKCISIYSIKNGFRDCLTCGKTFTTCRKKTKYCSRECVHRRINQKKIDQLSENEQLLLLRKSFNNFVIKNDQCWEWKGSLSTKGYGRINYKGKKILAHRASWILHNGPIPEALLVCHTCDNPKCTKFSHLFLGTTKDNVQDMMKKKRNRFPFGEKVSLAKLKVEQVVQIKNLLAQNMTDREVSVLFNVSISSIYRIRIGRTWKHVSIKPSQQ